MMDVVEGAAGRRFRALDLGCGPGSFSERILRRFPRARVVAVDYDPVVLRVGQGALGTFGGRLTWVDARLGHPGWTNRIPSGRYDAAVSTTALHWLDRSALRRLYADLAGRIRRGGVVLNGDHLPWPKEARAFTRLAEAVRARRFAGHALSGEWTGWRKWWKSAERAPELRAAFQDRELRDSTHPTTHDPTTLSDHVRALRRAGFREVDVVWQDLTNRVVCAIR